MVYAIIKFVIKHPWLTALIVLAPIALIIFGIILIIAIIGGGASVQNQCNSNSSGDDDTSISGGSGDWTKKGSANYNGAKSFFAALKAKGANDTQAAGVIGTLARESGGAFRVPDIAQGFYLWTSNPTESSAGISSPGVASKAEASSGGVSKTGASMFQYTPFTKYAPASDKSKWRSYPDLINYWFKTQVPGQGQSISGLKKCGSLADAVHWTLQVEEGGGSSDAFSDRLSKAHQAYSAFAGTGGDASADASSTASTGSSSCSGSSTSDTADGTGSIKEKPSDGNTTWSEGHLPSDVKPYIHDPQDAGLSYKKDGKGWSDPGPASGDAAGQCVDFACSYFHALWGLKKPYVMGDGRDMVNSWSNAIKGTKAKSPSQGSIGASTCGWTGGNHTFIIEHVLANGDFLIAEENWPRPNGSGHDIGSRVDWNFAVWPKDTPDTQYFKPSGKSLKWSK